MKVIKTRAKAQGVKVFIKRVVKCAQSYRFTSWEWRHKTFVLPEFPLRPGRLQEQLRDGDGKYTCEPAQRGNAWQEHLNI